MFRRWWSWLNNVRAVVLAVVVHVLVLGILAVNFDWTDNKVKSINPATPAKTRAVDSRLVEKEVERQRLAERKREQEEQERKKKIEQEEKRLAEIERQRKARERELKKQEEQKRLAEKKRKERLEREKKLAEQKRRAEAEKKRKEELEKKRREQEAIAKRQKELQEALAAEETASLIEHYESLINQHVQERWDVPPDSSIRIGMKCQITAQLLPSGDILSLSVKESSGNRLFDDSAIKALRRAEPLPLPPAEENLFHEFRSITIPFVLKSKKT